MCPRIIFPLKNIHNFQLRIFSRVAVYFCLAHSSHCNFLSTMPRSDAVVFICRPYRSGSQGEYILCVGWQEPQINKLWTFARMELLAKFILLCALTSSISPVNVSKTITPLKKDVEWSYMAKDPSMGALNGSLFLSLFRILRWLRLITSWFPNRAGETELGFDYGIGKINL